MADKSKDKKLMDVSRPGKSAPSATSRPIIVTHGPMMQDPMVQKEEPAEEVKVAAVSHEKVIEQPAAPAEEPVVKPEEKPQPEADEPAPKPPEEPKPESDSMPLDGDSGATVEAVADSARDKKKADEEVKAAETEKAKVSQLVAERKYFVPLSVTSHKRHHRTALILTLILLAAVVGAAVYAYDAGLLDGLF